MTADDFLAHAPERVGHAPLTQLVLTGSLAGRGADLAARPELRGLQRLVLSGTQLGDEDLAALAQSPHLGELRDLILEMNRIGDAGIEALAASTSLPRLEYVGLLLNPGRNPVDYRQFCSDTDSTYEPVERGKELEAKYGRIRWLHPDG